ncbi:MULTISPECIES: hypothetical protein [unclassified Photobacterium]|uniref:hypothetical protein n=1 Tax=unclassified Photobacterium TaxID=2628852 RepID=UPI001EDEEB9C|nr:MULTISPECIES: hypothetical protein [unclassified Photobacterium]MCG3863607.1 hypothetical protein [Photobacterium sp. Ph6]MCG3875136.1 hypothetical protein [Photobacterium sp. Ph5]
MKKTMLLLPLAFLFFGCDAQTSTTKTIATSRVEQCSEGEYAYSLPVDIEKYTHAMALFSQEGGVNPYSTTQFKQTCHSLPQVEDKLAYIAEQSAQATLPYPEAGKVLYFKQVDDTVYVVLEAQEDGWAGVSAAMAAAEPVITRNIQLNSSMKHVMFSYAPGDEKQS